MAKKTTDDPPKKTIEVKKIADGIIENQRLFLTPHLGLPTSDEAYNTHGYTVDMPNTRALMGALNLTFNAEAEELIKSGTKVNTLSPFKKNLTPSFARLEKALISAGQKERFK